MTKWGDKPIRDDKGEYDHRGRKWPICQCPCMACLTAWICLGVSGEDLADTPSKWKQ